MGEVGSLEEAEHQVLTLAVLCKDPCVLYTLEVFQHSTSIIDVLSPSQRLVFKSLKRSVNNGRHFSICRHRFSTDGAFWHQIHHSNIDKMSMKLCSHSCFLLYILAL